MSAKFLSAILGPKMAAPSLWAPGKMRSFCRKKTHVHKIPPLGGDFGFWVLGWGGKCRFYFYVCEDFSEKIAARQWGVIFCREASRCLAGPSGQFVLKASSGFISKSVEKRVEITTEIATISNRTDFASLANWMPKSLTIWASKRLF